MTTIIIQSALVVVYTGAIQLSLHSDNHIKIEKEEKWTAIDI